MVDEFTRNLWESLLKAELNGLYYQRIGLRYQKWDKYFKIVLTTASSGTVASWLLANQWDEIWKALSLLTAIAAIILQVLNWTEIIFKISEIRTKWIQIYHKYLNLWIEFQTKQIQSKTAMKRFAVIQDEVQRAKTDEFKMPTNEKILDECYNEMKKARDKQEYWELYYEDKKRL